MFIQPGYSITQKTVGLDFPTSIAFSGNRTWVSESGVSASGGVGQVQNLTQAKVKEIDQQGNARVILSQTDFPEGTIVPPITDITFRDGWLWMTHRQKGVNGWNVGAISKFQPDNPKGSFLTVLSNLPSAGDYSTNSIMFDSSGRAYFTQGTATDAGVVGLDNFQTTQWAQNAPRFKDYPPVGIALSGAEYITNNPQGGLAITGPYSVFNSGLVADGFLIGNTSAKNQQDGLIAGTGTVYSLRPE